MRFPQLVKYGLPVLLMLICLSGYSIESHAISTRVDKPAPTSEKDDLLSTLRDAAISMRE